MDEITNKFIELHCKPVVCKGNCIGANMFKKFLKNYYVIPKSKAKVWDVYARKDMPLPVPVGFDKLLTEYILNKKGKLIFIEQSNPNSKK